MSSQQGVNSKDNCLPFVGNNTIIGWRRPVLDFKMAAVQTGSSYVSGLETDKYEIAKYINNSTYFQGYPLQSLAYRYTTEIERRQISRWWPSKSDTEMKFQWLILENHRPKPDFKMAAFQTGSSSISSLEKMPALTAAVLKYGVSWCRSANFRTVRPWKHIAISSWNLVSTCLQTDIQLLPTLTAAILKSGVVTYRSKLISREYCCLT